SCSARWTTTGSSTSRAWTTCARASTCAATRRSSRSRSTSTRRSRCSARCWTSSSATSSPCWRACASAARKRSPGWRRPSAPRPSARRSRCSSSTPAPAASGPTRRPSRRRRRRWPRACSRTCPRSGATTRAPAAAARSTSTAMDSSPDDLPTEVVAGVIADPRGRILLARRTEGRDLAGLWEFPGGKREPDETPEETLARELREELGIEVEVGAPLITVPHRYPHKRLRLDVRHIDAWTGTPKGLDGQALAWVPPHKLASYAMPAADRPVLAALSQPDRYLVTPAPEGDGAAWLASLERAVSR